MSLAQLRWQHLGAMILHQPILNICTVALALMIVGAFAQFSVVIGMSTTGML